MPVDIVRKVSWVFFGGGLISLALGRTAVGPTIKWEVLAAVAFGLWLISGLASIALRRIPPGPAGNPGRRDDA